VRLVFALAMVFGCKAYSNAPAKQPDAAAMDVRALDAATIDSRAVDSPSDAAMLDAVMLDAAMLDAAAIDAGIDAPKAKPKKPRKKSRAACLEECNKRNMYTDCAGDEGGMMPCPCHCD
jgi:hypothetical protein